MVSIIPDPSIRNGAYEASHFRASLPETGTCEVGNFLIIEQVICRARVFYIKYAINLHHSINMYFDYRHNVLAGHVRWCKC
jgi:hypothetical protein